MTLPRTWKLFRALRHVNRMTQVKMRPHKDPFPHRQSFSGGHDDVYRSVPSRVQNKVRVFVLNCNSYIAFDVHGSRASPRTAYALTVHPELVEGFFELRC